MRWVFSLLGALIGAATGEEEGLFIGLGLGLLLGWAIQRERERARFLAGQPGGAGSSIEQHASDQLRALSERVAALERTVAALHAATMAAQQAEPLGVDSLQATPAAQQAEPLGVDSLQATVPRASEPEAAAPLEGLAAADAKSRRAGDAPTTSPLARALLVPRELLLGGNTVATSAISACSTSRGSSSPTASAPPREAALSRARSPSAPTFHSRPPAPTSGQTSRSRSSATQREPSPAPTRGP